MRDERAAAFTLPELLIVIAIIGVLAALIFVSMSHAFRLSERTRCVSNLNSLFKALKMREGDTLGSQRPAMKVTHWATQWGVLPYVDFNEDILICPAQGYTERRVNDEEFDQEWDLGQLGDWAGMDEDTQNVLKDDPYESVDISELVAIKTVAGSTTYITDFAPGPYCLKLSPDQYQDAWGGSSGRSRYGTDVRNKIGPYDGAGGDTTWYCFEDYGGDNDFKDIRVKVTDNGDGTFDLDCHMPAVGHTNSLVSKPEHKTLVQGPITGQGVTVGEVEEEKEQAVGGYESVANPYHGTQTGSEAALRFVTNYGLNAQSAISRENSRFLSDKPGRILLLDYYKPLAMASDAWTGTDLDPNQDGVPIFARHNHRVNVLFTDGAVKTLHPEEVNPAVPALQLEYWGH